MQFHHFDFSQLVLERYYLQIYSFLFDAFLSLHGGGLKERHGQA